MEYQKLVEISSMEIGVSKNDNWVFIKGNQRYEYEGDSEADIIFLLPLLEINYDSLNSLVTNSLEGLNTPDLYSSFPVRAILITALNSNSEYWIKLAFNWLDEIGDSKFCYQEVFRISSDKNMSQKTRHQALNLLSRNG